MIEYFIDVARECFNIGNFNSLMAIICECFLEDTSFIFIGPVKRIHGKFANSSVLLMKTVLFNPELFQNIQNTLNIQIGTSMCNLFLSTQEFKAYI